LSRVTACRQWCRRSTVNRARLGRARCGDDKAR
jgi:hypothetical protein